LSAFTKTILFDFDNFDDMNNKEKELVQLSNCYPNDPMSYNLREGGSSKLTELTKQLISQIRIEKGISKGENNPMFGDFEHTKGLRKCAEDRIGKTIGEIYGKEKADELRKTFSENTKGENNPMFGKNPFQGKTKDEIKAIKDKERKTKNAKTPEEKKITKDKQSKASKKSWKSQERRDKQAKTIANKTPEQKQLEN